jgi:putative oxidoreductase
MKMNEKTKGTILLVIKGLLTLAFLGAGLSKLFGVQMLVDEFALIGIGQWFRYATGIIEVAAAILLWVPGMTFLGAGLMTCVCIGAIIAHIAILGTATMAPAVVLLVLAVVTLYANRGQFQNA